MKYVLVLIFLMILVACESNPTKPIPQKPDEPVTSYASLYWEKTTEIHPERIAWTNELSKIIEEHLPLYDAAKDIEEVCPKYFTLSNREKIKAIGEFWVAIAKHESSFNPKSSSVDVGTVGNFESYSQGLFQMSGRDNSAKKFNCNYACLLDPIMNIKVATEQMRKQLNVEGLLYLDNKSIMRYWATILKNNKYSQIPDINARVKKYSPACI